MIRNENATRRPPQEFAPQSENHLNPKLSVLAMVLLGIAIVKALRVRDEEVRPSPREPSLRRMTGNSERTAGSLHRNIPDNGGIEDNDRTPLQGRDDEVKESSPDPDSRIENELVVILPAGAKIQDLLMKLGGGAELVGSMDKLNAHRLRFDDAESADAAKALFESSPALGKVDSNYSIARPAPEGTSDETSGLNQTLRVSSNQKQGEIVIGLVDSTVQLQGTAVDGYLLPGISVAEGTASEDTLTHGTTMAASIVQGLSLGTDGQTESSVKILPVDVFGGQESTNTYQVAEGIAAAIESGANIINLSLGSDGDSDLMHQLIQDGHSQGVIFLGAAGNEPVTSETYPAAYSEVIAVTATDFDGNIASYANRGEFVDVAVPGSVIVDANGKQYLVSGTSASTALASGIAAGYAEKNGAKPAEAETVLRAGLSVQTK